jgi:hypothetical protein
VAEPSKIGGCNKKIKRKPGETIVTSKTYKPDMEWTISVELLLNPNRNRFDPKIERYREIILQPPHRNPGCCT